MKKVVLAFLVLCMIISCFPAAAMANDAMIVGGTGGTVYAISNSDVEMEEEIINITVKDGKTYVSCQFFFHNTGEKASLMMGFPTGRRVEEPEDEGKDVPEDDEYEGPEDEYMPDLNAFRTYVRGKRAPVKVKSGLKPEGNISDDLYFQQWYTWNVTFDKDERVKVVNKYWAENTRGLTSDWEEINYILRSGSTWKGNIGKATIRMKINGYDLSGISFEEMQPSHIEEDGTIVWQAENIEPKEDIFVYYEYDYDDWQALDNPFDDSSVNYEKYNRMGSRMLRNFKARHYNGTTWWGNKFLRKFGDTQSGQFYYVMGVSYYKLGRYKKAAEMLDKALNLSDMLKDSNLYYKALVCKKIGDEVGYRKCVEYLSTNKSEWFKLWAKSRLADMGEAC